MSFLLAHWHALAMVGGLALLIVAVQVFLPGVWPLVLGWALKALRWLVGSTEGRIALIAVLAVATFLEYGHRRFSAGLASGVAQCHAASAKAQAQAAAQALKRDTSAQAIGQKTQADTGRAIEQGKAATMAAQGRTDARIKAQSAVAGCAGPDPGVMSDVQASASRLRAAEDRMRRIGTAAPSR